MRSGAAVVNTRRSEIIDRLLPLGLSYPSLLLVLILILIPVAYEIVLSFSHLDPYTGAQRLVGLDNYGYVVDQPAFWKALSNAALYAVVTTTLQLLLGVLIALFAFRQAARLRSWFRALAFLPYVVPPVASVIIFSFLFDNQTGLIPDVLSSFGIEGDWYSSKGKLFSLLVLISVWQYTPFVFMIVLARLETIPKGILEAAEADGAHPGQTFRRIILPLLRETLLATVLLRLIFMFTKFDIPWLLAGSRGTNRLIETLPVYNFRLAFEMRQFGDAAACGVLLFVVSAVVIVVTIFLIRRNWRTT